MTVEMFVVLGNGRFSFGDGDIRVGSTPTASLGDGFSYTVFSTDRTLAVTVELKTGLTLLR